MPDDRIEWFLDPEKGAHRNSDEEKRRILTSPKIRDCSQCGTLCEAGKACPHCGFLPTPKPKIVIPREGELVEIKGGKPSAAVIDQQRWHGELTAIAKERGYQSGWVAHKFKEKFGFWPPRGTIAPIDPSNEVRAWVRSRNIAWAKVQEKMRSGS
jgi:DNA repair protein RadD